MGENEKHPIASTLKFYKGEDKSKTNTFEVYSFKKLVARLDKILGLKTDVSAVQNIDSLVIKDESDKEMPELEHDDEQDDEDSTDDDENPGEVDLSDLGMNMEDFASGMMPEGEDDMHDGEEDHEHPELESS